MAKELNLDGGEISIIKAMGLGGTEMSGAQLLLKVSDLLDAELIDCLHGLISQGYVISDTASFKTLDDLKRASFHVNSGYSKDLKEALDPQPTKPKSRRVRRE